MVRAFEIYGYPLGKVMQHRKRKRHPKGCKLEKVYAVGFSVYTPYVAIRIGICSLTVIQRTDRFSRCKVAACGFHGLFDHME